MDPDEVVRLWVEDGLNTYEIAEKVGATLQRVSGILREQNIALGPKRYRTQSKAADPVLLRKLYVDQQLTTTAIGEQLGLNPSTVGKWLRRHEIPRRKRGETLLRFPEMRQLKIGESMDVPRIEAADKRTWTRYYEMATAAGIRVSLRSVDEKTLRLTRVA